MYKHILLPTDASELSERAVREGIRLAKSIGAKVTGLHVTPPFYPMGMSASAIAANAQDHAARTEESAEYALGFVTHAAREAGVPAAVLHRVADNPWEEIIKTAQEHGCDLVFMASHGRRGVAALVLGSETNKVLTHSKVPVLVAR